MDVILTGTGSPLPDPNRAGPSTLVKAGDTHILEYHSGVVEAAQIAARVGAKRLALTHMVPAPTPDQYPEWVALAAEHYDGNVIIGDDLTTITI
jgi:ribonuclease BN (tRNA processing enzyme)